MRKFRNLRYVTAYPPAGFIARCLPTKAETLPSGEMWLHEIKHDGFRLLSHKDGGPVRLCGPAMT